MPGMLTPSKGLQQIKTVVGASLTKAYNHGIAETLREAAMAK